MILLFPRPGHLLQYILTKVKSTFGCDLRKYFGLRASRITADYQRGGGQRDKENPGQNPEFHPVPAQALPGVL